MKKARLVAVDQNMRRAFFVWIDVVLTLITLREN